MEPGDFRFKTRKPRMFKSKCPEVREPGFCCGVHVKDRACGIDFHNGIWISLGERSEPGGSFLCLSIPDVLGEQQEVQQTAAGKDEEPAFECLIGGYYGIVRDPEQ